MDFFQLHPFAGPANRKSFSQTYFLFDSTVKMRYNENKLEINIWKL